ncbi:MAG TPA: flagellar biosynthesis protein FlhB [Acidobacteriota bacterium]|nr:flagellar biosynthesis protein FlhB [Acidobacteriota bacterium]
MSGGKDNKTEKPTYKKLKKAREKGQVARSKEVPSAAVLMGVLIVFYFFGRTFVGIIEMEMQHLFTLAVPSEITVNSTVELFTSTGLRLSAALLPVFLAIMGFSIFGNLIQGELTFSTHPLGFRFEKLNPINGLKKIFSKNGLVQLAKSLIMIVGVGVIGYQVVNEHLAEYPRLLFADAKYLFAWIFSVLFEICLRVGILLILLAFADFCFEKYQYKEQLKMSKKEIREEFKETEGDPITKGRIRRIQREMARKRMMADVPKADVVITNPTHYAVALSYKMDSMEAPKVVAKGVGFLALKIKELAREHDIPMVENKQLAHTLYKSVEIGAYIPGDLYKAIAEILAYVYKAKRLLS